MKKRIPSGRRRVSWEVYWINERNRECLVQEMEYSAVLMRLNRLHQAGVTRWGYRQIPNIR